MGIDRVATASTAFEQLMDTLTKREWEKLAIAWRDGRAEVYQVDGRPMIEWNHNEKEVLTYTEKG